METNSGSGSLHIWYVTRRARRLSERFESFPAKQITVLLSPQAAQALEMLTKYRVKSQKQVIEELLIHAYANQKKICDKSQ